MPPSRGLGHGIVRIIGVVSLGLAALIGVYWAVTWVEFSVCVPRAMERIGAAGNYSDLLVFTESALLPGMDRNQVEAQLQSMGVVSQDSDQTYSGTRLVTYRVHICWTPLTDIVIGAAFDLKGHLISANNYGDD